MPEYTVNATALFPIHVGGGQDALLDPLDYVVGDGSFYRVDLEGMFASAPAFADTFVELTDKNRIIDLRKQMAAAFDPVDKSHWRWRAGVSKNFQGTYRQKIGDLRNQLLVQCLPRARGVPYIPGSSIKGAMRTAVLDQRAEAKGYAHLGGDIDRRLPDLNAPNRQARASAKNKAGQWAETLTLEGNPDRNGQIRPESDPFKGVKIGDAVLPPDSTEIAEVRNVTRENKALSLDMFVETVKPGTQFTFPVTIDPATAMSFHRGRGRDKQPIAINKPVKLKEIIAATHYYYQTALKNEEEKFYQGKRACEWVDKVFAIDEEPRADSKTVIRVGRFSHLESMTFNHEALRRPEPPTHRKTREPKAWGTTRNLVDGFVPLGFIKVEFVEA